LILERAQLEFLASTASTVGSNADAIEQVKDLLQKTLAEQKTTSLNASVVYEQIVFSYPISNLLL
jgi:hypothetical protein